MNDRVKAWLDDNVGLSSQFAWCRRNGPNAGFQQDRAVCFWSHFVEEDDPRFELLNLQQCRGCPEFVNLVTVMPLKEVTVTDLEQVLDEAERVADKLLKVVAALRDSNGGPRRQSKKKSKVVSKTLKGIPDEDELDKMSRPELRSFATEMDIDTKGMTAKLMREAILEAKSTKKRSKRPRPKGKLKRPGKKLSKKRSQEVD